MTLGRPRSCWFRGLATSRTRAALLSLAFVALGRVLFAAELDLARGERLLVVAPHPDDESLGAGGLMQRVLARGGAVHVVLMTAGDGYIEALQPGAGASTPGPDQFVAYGALRYHEARAAVRTLGGGRIGLDLLGFPDGGLRSLLGPHWWRVAAARSPFTGADKPPYVQAREPHVPYDGSDLRAALVRVLQQYRPTLIALPDWLDQHDDHSATAMFVLLAADDWLRGHGHQTDRPLRLLTYLIHWNNWPPRPPGWKGRELPHGSEIVPLELPHDLPPRELSRVTLTLSDHEVRTKAAALMQHETQRQTNPYQLGVFVRSTEPFTVVTGSELPRVQQVIEPVRARRAASRG